MSHREQRLEKQARQRISANRPDAALVSCQKWTELTPDNVDAWFYTAIAQQLLLRYGDANISIDKALSLDPENQRYVSRKAKILTATHAMAQVSADAIQQAVSLIRPYEDVEIKHPEVMNIFSSVYHTGRDFVQATRYAEMAVAAAPDNANYHNNLAVLLQHANRQQPALDHYNRAIELNPQNFSAYWQLAQLDKALLGPDFIDRCQTRLSQAGDTRDAAIYLNFALARQYERNREFEESFEYLQRGNAAVKKCYPYRYSDDVDLYQCLEEQFPVDLFNENREGCNSREPIFIVGMPRTGTTLVEQIIAQADSVETAGELRNFTTLFDAACMTLNPGQEGLDKYQGLDRIDYRKLGDDFIKSSRPMAGHSPQFIDKYPFNFALVGAIALALPQAKFVHLQRNPMDTCFSNFKHLFRLGFARHSYSLEDLGHYYLAYDRLMAHWNRCLPDRLYNLSYDRLVETPEEETRKLKSFLGLPWDEKTLDFHQSDKPVATPSAAQVRQGIYRSSRQHWKNYEQQLQPLAELILP